MSTAECISSGTGARFLMLWILVPTLGVAVGVIVLAVSTLPTDFVLFPPLVSIVLMLVITWVWLTGKDRR